MMFSSRGENMTWRSAVEAAIRRYVSKTSNPVFTRRELLEAEGKTILAQSRGGGRTPYQTISRVLQELRRDGIVAFVDDRGTYRLSD